MIALGYIIINAYTSIFSFLRAEKKYITILPSSQCPDIPNFRIYHSMSSLLRLHERNAINPHSVAFLKLWQKSFALSAVCSPDQRHMRHELLSVKRNLFVQKSFPKPFHILFQALVFFKLSKKHISERPVPTQPYRKRRKSVKNTATKLWLY